MVARIMFPANPSDYTHMNYHTSNVLQLIELLRKFYYTYIQVSKIRHRILISKNQSKNFRIKFLILE